MDNKKKRTTDSNAAMRAKAQTQIPAIVASYDFARFHLIGDIARARALAIATASSEHEARQLRPMGRPFAPTETKHPGATAYVKNTHARANTRANEDVFSSSPKTGLIDQSIQLLSRMAKHINAILAILIIHGRRYHLAAIVSHVCPQIQRLRNGDAGNHVT